MSKSQSRAGGLAISPLNSISTKAPNRDLTQMAATGAHDDLRPWTTMKCSETRSQRHLMNPTNTCLETVLIRCWAPHALARRRLPQGCSALQTLPSCCWEQRAPREHPTWLSICGRKDGELRVSETGGPGGEAVCMATFSKQQPPPRWPGVVASWMPPAALHAPSPVRTTHTCAGL